MLEKLATHDVEGVATLYGLADKCAKAAEGRAWHSTLQDGTAQPGGSGVTSKGSSKKKKKDHGRERPQAGAPVAAAAPGGRNSQAKRPRQQGGDGKGSCPVHPNAYHSAADCREIKKLAQRVSERQTSREVSPPQRPLDKGKAVDDGETAAAGERDLGYQSPDRTLKSLYEDDSDSGDSERRKKLYVMYGGSGGLASRREVKTLRREVLATRPGPPRAWPHQKWQSTTISFGPSDCSENMAGASILPIITSPVIANIRLHHVLIDGGAALSVISYAAFKQLQIPESKLIPSRPFSGVGPHPVWPVGNIRLPVMFGAHDNFRTETIQFDVAEVNLSTPSLADRHSTGSWRLPITGIWS